VKALSLALLLIGVLLFPGFSQPPCQWAPGMYWEWREVLSQSTDAESFTAVYVLKSERWGDYETDLLATVRPYSGGEIVQLGVVVREPCGPVRGFGFWAYNAHRWAYYPEGAVIGEQWQGGSLGDGFLQVKIIDKEAVAEVPAGTFENCVHFVLASEHQDANTGESSFEREEIWFDPFLGWPIRQEYEVSWSGLNMHGTLELVSYGTLTVEGAVSRVLAALEEMETLGDPFVQKAQKVRGQLQSLGLLPEG